MSIPKQRLSQWTTSTNHLRSDLFQTNDDNNRRKTTNIPIKIKQVRIKYFTLK